MNKILIFMGWKTPRGKWDKVEVLVDLGLLAVVVIIIGVMVWLKQLT